MYQAEKLDEFLKAHGQKLDKVIDLEVEEEELMARLTGRRVCRSCGASFHIVHILPKKDGVCDFCGGELFSVLMTMRKLQKIVLMYIRRKLCHW